MIQSIQVTYLKTATITTTGRWGHLHTSSLGYKEAKRFESELGERPNRFTPSELDEVVKLDYAVRDGMLIVSEYKLPVTNQPLRIPVEDVVSLLVNGNRVACIG